MWTSDEEKNVHLLFIQHTQKKERRNEMSNEKNNVGPAKKNDETNVSIPSPATAVSPANDNKNNNQLGYGAQFPANLLEEKVFELRYKEKARKVGLIVSKSLLAINLYSPVFAGKINAGDFVIKINNISIKRKAQIYDFLEKAVKSHETFTITVKRPKWLTATSVVPKGYDLAPGYEYFSGILVLYPNSTVGLNVKAFCSRVYVVRVEVDSIAVHTCMAGDCIVDIDGDPITTVNDCSEKIIKALKEKKYVLLTIERASTPMTIRAVRCALYAEKTQPLDPRLATDTQKMGEQEAAKIKTGKVPPAPKGILKAPGTGVNGFSFYGTEKPHLEVRPESEEYTIGCEPYNPLFLNKVKQRGDKQQSSQQQPPSSQVSSQQQSQRQQAPQIQKTQQATATTNNSSTGTNKNDSLTSGGSSGEKVNLPSQQPGTPRRKTSSTPKKNTQKKSAEDDNSKRNKGPPGTSDVNFPENEKTDRDISSKRGVGKEDDGSKRATGSTRNLMPPAAVPSTPTTTPPNRSQEEKDNKKVTEKSKKGIRGKTMAAIKSVTGRRTSNEKSVRK